MADAVPASADEGATRAGDPVFVLLVHKRI
jgi:hypothetical protein